MDARALRIHVLRKRKFDSRASSQNIKKVAVILAFWWTHSSCITSDIRVFVNEIPCRSISIFYMPKTSVPILNYSVYLESQYCKKQLYFSQRKEHWDNRFFYFESYLTVSVSWSAVKMSVSFLQKAIYRFYAFLFIYDPSPFDLSCWKCRQRLPWE